MATEGATKQLLVNVEHDWPTHSSSQLDGPLPAVPGI